MADDLPGTRAVGGRCVYAQPAWRYRFDADCWWAPGPYMMVELGKTGAAVMKRNPTTGVSLYPREGEPDRIARLGG